MRRIGPWTAGVFLAACLLSAAAPAAESAARRAVQDMVVREARAMKFPAALALAVAHAESNFEPRAESRKGARGVMQIMPATAAGDYGIRAAQLWEPRINIRLGIHFLKRLLRRYRGRTDLALSYYNGGSAVGDGSRARVIPATRTYVQRVLSLRGKYRERVRVSWSNSWIRTGRPAGSWIQAGVRN